MSENSSWELCICGHDLETHQRHEKLAASTTKHRGVCKSYKKTAAYLVGKEILVEIGGNRNKVYLGTIGVPRNLDQIYSYERRLAVRYLIKNKRALDNARKKVFFQ